MVTNKAMYAEIQNHKHEKAGFYGSALLRCVTMGTAIYSSTNGGGESFNWEFSL